jgi:type I restriction enzyme S subunit
MPSNYKRLGDYIHKVENRNRELKVSKLVGLSMTKEFRVSTSNIVGTDMSVYKVVNKWQFSCDFMSVIRVHKFPVVLKTDDEPVLVSPAYTVFEVNDENELNPEYLMMWFRRSEFDRYADFKCDSAIRGGFDWDALCDCNLPIPSIEKQQEIVREYHTIQNRIALNNQWISKLEETAQVIYKQWFVEFEFPDENGKPYKSNGGKMVWCEELEKEIPEGWEYNSLTKEIKLSGGGTPATQNLEFWNGTIPFFTPADIKGDFFVFKTEKNINENGLKGSSTKLYPKNTTFVTARGTVGSVAIAGVEMSMNQSCYAITGKYSFYTHQLILSCMRQLKSEAIGAVFSALVTKDFDSQFIVSPKIEIIEKFENKIHLVYDVIHNYTLENQKLEELKDLLLAKMTRVESEKEIA